MGPTWVSSPHCQPRAHPAPVAVRAPAHAAASTAEQQGTPGQQRGGGWRRGVKPQRFHYTFVGQGLPKTSASPSLVKCPRREIRRSPTNVLAQGLLHAPPWCVKGPGGKLRSLFSPSALIAACPSSLHTSLHRRSHVLWSEKSRVYPEVVPGGTMADIALLQDLGLLQLQNLPSLPGRQWCFHPTACPWSMLRNSHLL